MTDEWLGYNGLKTDFNHIQINHKEKEYVRGGFHTNTIEGFWSLLKRGIYGIYHQVSPKHLHRYCDEFSFRYNTRNISDKTRFNVLLENVNCRLTYDDLVNNNEKEKSYKKQKTANRF